MTMGSYLTGIAGGAASALLFAAVTSGGVLGVPLFLLAPLPVAIVSFGWGTVAGLIAALSAAIAIGAFTTTEAGLVHAFVVGLPMAVYAHLIGLARPSGGDGELEWYPLSRVTTALVFLTAVSLVLAGVSIGFDVDTMTAEAIDALNAMAAAAGGSAGSDTETFAKALHFYMRVLPFAFAMLWPVVMSVNLWLGGRVARLSGRWRRPDESIAEAIDLPPIFVILLAVALVLAFVDGPIGLIAGAFAGSSLIGFAALGLATLHIYMRGNPAAGVVLTFTYATTFIISLPLIPLIVAGLLDRPLGLRRKRLERLKRGG